MKDNSETETKPTTLQASDATTCSPISDWLANGRVGMSSKTMAMIALGVNIKEVHHPCDPDDLNRCLILLEKVPEVRDSFPEIAKKSEAWRKLITRWSELEKSFIDEVGLNWCKARSAPKTYKLIQDIFS